MHEVFEGTSPFDHIVGTLTNSAGLLRAIIVGSGTHNHSQACFSSLSLTVPCPPSRPFLQSLALMMPLPVTCCLSSWAAFGALWKARAHCEATSVKACCTTLLGS